MNTYRSTTILVMIRYILYMPDENMITKLLNRRFGYT